MARFRTYLLLMIVYSSAFTGITSTLVRGPLNTPVIRGSAVTLSCGSDDSNSFIQWYSSLCVTSREIRQCTSDRIYSGTTLTGNVPPSFSVTEENNGTHVTRDLNISPIQLTDAGVYLCAEVVAYNPRATDSRSAQLIVVDGNSSCVTNLSSSGAVQKNDNIMMTCSITYRGNWAPVMRWFVSDTRHNFTDDYITLTTSNTTVTSQLTVTASAGLHGSQIVCVTYFTQSPTTLRRTTATNIPSYTHTWTSPTVNIGLSPSTPAVDNNSNRVSAAYKSATIALAVIAVIAIVIIVLLVLYIVNVLRRHRAGDRQSGDSAAAPEITSHSPGDAYQQINMTSRNEPLYNQLQRSS